MFLDPDNLTITYAHNLSPVDPYSNLFAFEPTAPADYVIDKRGGKRWKRDTGRYRKWVLITNFLIKTANKLLVPCSIGTMSYS